MQFHDLIKQYNSIKPGKEQETRETLLNRFRQTFPQKTRMNLGFYLSLERIAVGLTVFIFISAFSSGLIYVAKGVLPGNFLYPVKLGAEEVRMVFALNQSQKTVLRAEILTNRLSEVNVLAKKVEEGDKNAEPELQELSKSVSNDLYILKQQVAAQVQVDSQNSVGYESLSAVQIPAQIKPFPEEDLLATGQAPIIDESQASLPIQDQMPVFTVIQSQELKQLLAETKDLLADENLITALAKIEQAEKVVMPSSPVEPAEEKEQEIQPEIKEPEAETPVIEQKPQSSIINRQPSVVNQKSSVGQILPKAIESSKPAAAEKKENVSVGIKREVPVKTGLIREK